MNRSLKIALKLFYYLCIVTIVVTLDGNHSRMNMFSIINCLLLFLPKSNDFREMIERIFLIFALFIIGYLGGFFLYSLILYIPHYFLLWQNIQKVYGYKLTI